MNITPANLQFIFFQADMRFQAAYMNTETFWQKIASESPSGSRETHYGWLGRIPKMRQWLGDRVINNLAAREYTLKNLPYEDTVRLDAFDIKDEQMAVFSQGVEMLGIAAKQWPDDILTTLILAASASTTLCFDGQPFFSASHPQNPDVPGGTTYSNLFDSTTSGSLPLTAANYASARATMLGYLGEDGLPLGVVPTILMVPPALGITARTILNAQIIAVNGPGAASSAAASQTNVLMGTAEVLENPFLTNATRWYLLCGKFPIKPFVFQTRDPVSFTYLVDPKDPNVFFRHDFLYGANARGNVGVTLPFLALSASA